MTIETAMRPMLLPMMVTETMMTVTVKMMMTMPMVRATTTTLQICFAP